MSPSVRLSIEPDILNEPSRRLETLQPEGTVMIVGPSANSNTFGNLPDELVVEIFRKFLAPSSDSKSKWTAIRGVSRRTLSLVCKRWKEIVESVVCITVPEEATLALPDDSSGSQYVAPYNFVCSSDCFQECYHSECTLARDLRVRLRSLSGATITAQSRTASRRTRLVFFGTLPRFWGALIGPAFCSPSLPSPCTFSTS